MYPREARIKAVQLYIKYDKCVADVIYELGYPSRKTLVKWFREQESGVVWDKHIRRSKYSLEQKQAAVDHFLEYGRNISRTVRALGYPSRDILRSWCNELVPELCKRRNGGVKYNQEQKNDAVIV